jgi:hypothetical protein
MSIAEELHKLNDLHRNGAINDAEYSRAKALLLQQTNAPPHSSTAALSIDDSLSIDGKRVATYLSMSIAILICIFAFTRNGVQSFAVSLLWLFQMCLYVWFIKTMSLNYKWLAAILVGAVSCGLSFLCMAVAMSEFKIDFGIPARHDQSMLFNVCFIVSILLYIVSAAICLSLSFKLIYRALSK